MLDHTANTRTKRAQRILDNGGVELHNPTDRTFNVSSERDPDALYRVELKANSCTCRDAQPLYAADMVTVIRPANICKHIIAATEFERRMKADEAKPRTYANYTELFAALASPA